MGKLGVILALIGIGALVTAGVIALTGTLGGTAQIIALVSVAYFLGQALLS